MKWRVTLELLDDDGRMRDSCCRDQSAAGPDAVAISSIVLGVVERLIGHRRRRAVAQAMLERLDWEEQPEADPAECSD